MKYKFLYTNGDSYSAGAGLAYYKFFTEHPETFRSVSRLDYLDNRNKNQDILQFIYNELIPKMKDSYFKLLEFEKQSTFSRIISNRLNLEEQNDSTHGASLGRIYHTTITSLTELLKTKDPSEIFVVIMLTTPFRFLIPSNHSNQDIHINWNSNLNNEEKAIGSYFFKHATDEYFLLTAKAYIDALQHFLESNNLNYVFFDSWLYSTAIENVDIKLKNIMPVFDRPIIDRYDLKDTILFPCGHFNQRVHDDLANLIINDYLK